MDDRLSLWLLIVRLEIKIVVKLGIRHEWVFMLVVVSKWTATLLLV